MKRSRKRRQLFLFIVDFCILFAALYLALYIRNGVPPSSRSWHDHVGAFSFAFIGWAVIFYTAGLYALEKLFDGFRFAARLFWSIALSVLATVLMFYLRPGRSIEPKTVMLLFACLAYALLWLWRLAYGKLMRFSSITFNVAFIGMTDEVLLLADAIKDRPYLGYSLAFVHDEENLYPDSRLPTVTTQAELERTVEVTLPDLFVLLEGARLSSGTRRLLFGLIGRGARYVSLPEFYETIFRRVPIDAINDSWFLENIDLKAKKPYLMLKRLIDLIVSSVALIISAPICALLVVAVLLESRGPVIFKQVRLGRGGKPFTILKFRTMRIEGNSFMPTSIGDTRITRLGKFMRASRLDELPQFINIFRGDMSFVGPRPERPELAEKLEQSIPYYMERHLLKPGITGWDQVSGEYHSPSVEDTYKKLQFDLYYIKNTSLFLDISIFFKTIMTVLSRSGR
ncbi:MAG: hypothetical protein A2Z96_05820 [Spirochaetes bacterium GWB1_48_6]|nr:MAG: hypothetical protein A2Z96_05820 [Spirochaetes bacterium GWB1_48_6]